MDEIRSAGASILDELRESSSTRRPRAGAQDIEFARVGMLTMTAFTVALLLVVWTLARREIGVARGEAPHARRRAARLEQRGRRAHR